MGEEEAQQLDAEYQQLEQMALSQESPKIDDNLTRWQLSSKDILDDLKHDLRGEIFNEETDRWEITGTPLLNDHGVNTLISTIRPIASKISFLSNLSEEDIYNVVRDLNMDLNQLLFMRWKEFGVKREHLDLIIDMICYLMYIALKRALLEGERKFLKTTEKRIERVMSGMPAIKEEKKFMGLF